MATLETDTAGHAAQLLGNAPQKAERTQGETITALAFDGVILALWRKGLDTNAISLALGRHDFPEYRVANRLAQLRDAEAAR